MHIEPLPAARPSTLLQSGSIGFCYVPGHEMLSGAGLVTLLIRHTAADAGLFIAQRPSC